MCFQNSVYSFKNSATILSKSNNEIKTFNFKLLYIAPKTEVNSYIDIIDVAFLILIILINIGLIWFTLVSASEKENRAVKLSVLSIIGSSLLLVLPLWNFQFQNVLEISILSTIFLFVIFLLLPINNFEKFKDYTFHNKIDERDIMFSRIELKTNSENFVNYYRDKPEKLKIDNEIRKNPGLCSPNSKYYNPITFNLAENNFRIIEDLAKHLQMQASEVKQEISPDKISKLLKDKILKLGAIDCGITELKDYHKYSFHGRKHNYGEKVNLTHKYAIALTVEMNHEMVAAAPAGSTLLESSRQYLRSGTMAFEIAKYINSLGYEALAHIDGNYSLICPLVAKDAGLGEIGRMGLLMTPKLGPRVRIAVITTNLPLIPDTASYEPSVIDFCMICKKCADTCPGKAISSNGILNINGDLRWQINQEKCYNYWTVCGTDCGRCMAICPFSHPDNFIHNTVRKGIKNSMIFRRFALKMDDFLYGRKPSPKREPIKLNKYLKN